MGWTLHAPASRTTLEASLLPTLVVEVTLYEHMQSVLTCGFVMHVFFVAIPKSGLREDGDPAMSPDAATSTPFAVFREISPSSGLPLIIPRLSNKLDSLDVALGYQPRRWSLHFPIF